MTIGDGEVVNGSSSTDVNEASPLMVIGRQDSVETKKSVLLHPANKQKWLLAASILIGIVLGITIAAVGQRKRNSQTVVQKIVVVPDVNETAAANTSLEDNNVSPNDNVKVIEYRPVCEYYSYGQQRTTATTVSAPRILQTSMYEPDKPWSLRDCVAAQQPETVQLNVAAAPDAMLQVNFSSSFSSSSGKRSKPILGFGGAFTEAAALNFYTLQPAAQEAVLELLFGKSGLGYAIGRVPINSCDFAVASYTFDGVEVDDFALDSFDTAVQHDANTMVRMAKAAVATYNQAWIKTLNDDDDNNDDDDKSRVEQQNAFRLFASPWSPPAWMKRPTWEDSKNATHASKMTYSAEPNCLRDGVGPDSKYAAAWALYFSKFITAYQNHGLDLWAVTVQNEPEFAAPWEACAYTAVNMTDFVAYHLGPVLARDHSNVKILAFDHNKDHINAWMLTMLNGTVARADKDWNSSSAIAAQYIAGTAYHWYAGGMDRLLDGALGIANLHRYEENLAKLGRRDDHVLLGSESCHCPTTGYAGGDINIYWDRAERYAHTILADLAAGSQGWVEWNFILDGIGGPNHLGNLCEATILAVPHRALDAAAADLPPLPEFEQHSPMSGRIKGDERTREELNALGFPAKFLDLGIAVQPMYYYMGHISRHVRPGSTAVPGLVRQSLGSGEIFRPVGSTVLGGGENDLARVGIELLLWPCEGSTRQHFRWNLNDSKHITVLGHDWLGNQTRSCVGRETDKDFLGMRFTQCKSSTAGQFDVISIAGDKDERYLVKLLNHPMKHDKLCLVIRELKNGGGSYGPLGGAQVALGDCDSESAKWKLDLEAGTASSTYFADEISDNKVCMTTGWPFLQMGAFLTPNGSSPKTVVILNEAKDSANYALKDDGAVLLTGSIPPRSIQTILLD